MLLALALSASTCLLTAQDSPPPADGQQPPAAHNNGPRGTRGGFHLLPPGAAQRLTLTDDQKTQVAALEAETKAKLEKILTASQMKQLAKIHPPGRQGGQGGQGGPGGGGPDGNGPMGGGLGGPGGGPDANGGPGGPGGPGGDNQQPPPPQN